MKKIVASLLIVGIAVLSACNSSQSLQEYYVDNTNNPNFIALDLPASILNLEVAELTDMQKDALQSLKKLNVLAFKKTTQNAGEFEIEQEKVKNILKDREFVELMKLNSTYGKGVIKYIGDEDAIDEVIIYGSSDDKGFALIRVLGDNMNPGHILELMKVIQQADYDSEALGEIGQFLKG